MANYNFQKFKRIKKKNIFIFHFVLQIIIVFFYFEIKSPVDVIREFRYDLSLLLHISYYTAVQVRLNIKSNSVVIFSEKKKKKMKNFGFTRYGKCCRLRVLQYTICIGVLS